VTLTGPAGIGKTRLAVEAARRLDATHGSAWLVELASATDEAAVVGSIALTVSARESAGRPLLDAVASRLSSERALLLLDNCEHLIEACASVAGFLLEHCPRLRLLATSQETLGLAGEIVWAVPSLPVPAPGLEVDTTALAGCAAVRLFVERAESHRFSITSETGPAVAEICRRLDGLPLAIELAAARVGFLTAEQIAARLSNRFRLLTTGHRGASARHRTLLAALEWSHDLLSEPERAVFRRLACFSGTFDLDAAEQVCPGPGVEPEDVLDILGRLVARSLVVGDVSGPSARYRMLETIREFAREKLVAAAEEPDVRDAHVAWSIALAERVARDLTGADQEVSLQRLDVEHANFRAALEWSLQSGQPGHALALAVSLLLFWLVRGRMTEGGKWIERCLDVNPHAPQPLRIKALWGAGAMASLLGDFERARTAGDECLALARASEDAGGEARALNLLGFTSAFRDLPRARPLLEKSVEMAERAGDRWCMGNSLGLLGFAEVFRGDFNAAGPYFERCRAVAAESGDRQGLRMALLGTGYVALERGAYGQAEVSLVDGLEVARLLGDPFWTAVGLAYLGELARVRGEYKDADERSREAVIVARETGSPLLLGFCLSFAGRAALDAGELPEAHAMFEEALALPRVAGNPGNSVIALLGLGEVLLASGNRQRAARLFDEGLGFSRDRGDRLMIMAALLCGARFARSEGDPAQATELAHTALELSAELGHPPAMTAALELVAGLAAEDGRLDHATRLLGAASAFREESGCVVPVPERTAREESLALVAESLDKVALDAAWNQGRGLSLDEACAYA
ncbi:MAG: ATP-binding protein, partial [Acidimicrobiia bacterium]